MVKSLVIVESPAKAKTLEGYLGKDYKVLASFGHVRDLEAKDGAVDPDNDFAMRYAPVEKNQAQVDKIIKALKKSDQLLLATDQDREGEAISWHLYEMLKDQGLLKDKVVARIVFNQITKKAILDAVANPRELEQTLIDAQQARRALDFLVGFKLSPLLWKKIRTGLSAGRVQSPALRMIVEREQEIEAFKSKEYWSIHGDFSADKSAINAKLDQYQKEKLTQFSIENEKSATEIATTIQKVKKDQWEVIDIKEKTRKKEPPAPFITSTLQQEAVKKLGFTSSRTMRTAQTLYEGVAIGGGAPVGLITYMRTDSVMLADEAIGQIRDHIKKQFGKESVNPSIRKFKSKSKNAQEAHEAIRPTDITITPDQIKNSLSMDQYKLYRMIWQRTIAGQMIAASIDQVRADISDPKRIAVFKATGSSIRDPGFLKAYQEGLEETETSDTKETYLPKLTVGQKLGLVAVKTKQHFTEPPARYSEASLIKALEEHGIGRPSTWTNIISTIIARQYALLESKRFHPTDVGRIVNKFLTAYFEHYVDYEFTAQLEDDLDAVSRGEKEYKPLLEKFWSPFSKQLVTIEETVQRKDVTEEKTDEECPECKSHNLVIKLGRNGRFFGCSGYPDCKYTRAFSESEEEKKEEQNIVEGRKCPKCEANLVIKEGRYGKFIGCSQYPECKFIESLNKPEDTGVTCPSCKKGSLLKRRARRGNFFYSCSGYPKCKYIISHPPLNEPCVNCNFPITMHKVTKTKGEQIVCPECQHTRTKE
ncbi:MAG: type I DNA topoisomerase [Pseudomonadota bacterium]|nr:type I DNA topoisomerase [Pseudomonadota bacterium]